MQPSILSNFLCFCRTGIVSRWYHNNFDTSFILGMHILEEICYMTTPFPSIHFFYESLFQGSTWSDPSCQGHCVYFTTLVAAMHYGLFEENHRSSLNLLLLNILTFKKKKKNGFHGNSLADCKTYVPQAAFIWVVKIIYKVDFN